VLPELLLPSDSLDSEQREYLRHCLSVGPWLWPLDEEHIRALRELGVRGPPAAEPGQVLLLTTAASRDELHLFDPASVNRSGRRTPRIPLGFDATSAWNAAAASVPSALRVIWQSVTSTRKMPFRTAGQLCCYRIAELARSAERVEQYDGPSFGLPFALSVASLLTGLRVPEDLVATGAIDDSGQVHGVDGLARKIALVSATAPRIRDVMVPHTDIRMATTIAARFGLRVIGVQSVRDALESTWGRNAAARRLAEQTSEVAARSRMIEGMFDLVMQPPADEPWAPLSRGARLVRRTAGARLRADESSKLDIVIAVFQRHVADRGSLPILKAEWLEKYSAPDRIRIVTQFTQQWADAGVNDAKAARSLASRHLPTEQRDRYESHVKLQGALGRLLAVTGEPEEALRLEREAAIWWLARRLFAEVSKPLCVWYRLAGALARPDEYGAAEEVYQHELVRHHTNAFLEVERAAARIRLRSANHMDLRLLAQLAFKPITEPERRPWIRWWSLRWYVRLLAATGAATAADGMLAAQIAKNARQRDWNRNIAPFLGAAELERAIRIGDATACERALSILRKAEPGVIGNLERACPPGASFPQHVADFYPY